MVSIIFFKKQTSYSICFYCPGAPCLTGGNKDCDDDDDFYCTLYRVSRTNAICFAFPLKAERNNEFLQFIAMDSVQL